MFENLIEKYETKKEKNKTKKAQELCYNANKKAGLLYFNDKCKGQYEKIDGRKFPKKQCSVCPYFRRANNERP